ncbi:hypothetical protein GGR54DRAFT_211040 [Hypoxylon sp. NC1633]|nr:hypothetical protein GGR54DRAFT_211040 [Hypoxylon sp. NC1633]
MQVPCSWSALASSLEVFGFARCDFIARSMEHDDRYIENNLQASIYLYTIHFSFFIFAISIREGVNLKIPQSTHLVGINYRVGADTKRTIHVGSALLFPSIDRTDANLLGNASRSTGVTADLCMASETDAGWTVSMQASSPFQDDPRK